MVFDINKKCNPVLDFKYNILKFYFKHHMLLDDSEDMQGTHEYLTENVIPFEEANGDLALGPIPAYSTNFHILIEFI